MSEFLAPRCERMLDYLAVLEKDESRMNEWRDDVMGSVAVLRKLENLWTNAYNNIKVLDHYLEEIRYCAGQIEDDLEYFAIVVESEFMSTKEKKKRGIRKLLQLLLHKRYLQEVSNRELVSHMMYLVSGAKDNAEAFLEMFRDDKMEIVGEEECSRMAEGRNTLRRPMEIYYGDDHMEEEHFVGMEEELKQLISLVNDINGPVVVSIWGVEGSGKTALARKVYMHCRLEGWFTAFAWVSVGQDYETGDLLQDMLKQLGGGAIVNNETTEEIPVVDVLDQV